MTPQGMMPTLRYLGHNRLTYTGAETRRRYVWDGYGAEAPVLMADAAVLLFKRKKAGPCCGAPKHDAGPLFEEVGDYIADDTQSEELST